MSLSNDPGDGGGGCSPLMTIRVCARDTFCLIGLKEDMVCAENRLYQGTKNVWFEIGY